jgi:processive 1,2-diacylglycerol beta-glucosyltransferase
VNAIWYRCTADYFLVANQQSAAVVSAGGIASEMIRISGFPVSPKFADFSGDRELPSDEYGRRVLYMINAGTGRAPELVRNLLDLDIDLTVTVGRDEKLRRAVEAEAHNRKINIIGWTNQLPQMLHENHLLIGKAGGATVQEAIAACCPMIINHIVSGQEEGNAQLIVETDSGVIAHSSAEVLHQVERAFADGADQWSQWHLNISRLSRPRASLEIAEFLVSL